jgi:PIN domain nuclease of toxin-antitoxin system
VLDDPSSAAWFEKAIAVGWTRDPFDRLLIAHARLRKWRLATGDGALIAHLDAGEYLEL